MSDQFLKNECKNLKVSNIKIMSLKFEVLTSRNKIIYSRNLIYQRLFHKKMRVEIIHGLFKVRYKG